MFDQLEGQIKMINDLSMRSMQSGIEIRSKEEKLYLQEIVDRLKEIGCKSDDGRKIDPQCDIHEIVKDIEERIGGINE